jgi:UDP-N-acetylglucosamine transferase subunit ALG13
MTTLDSKKPLLVMLMIERYRVVVNDHQVAIAKKFSELGHILVAYDTADLPERISQLKSFVPKERKANPEAVADRIIRFLNSLQD